MLCSNVNKDVIQLKAVLAFSFVKSNSDITVSCIRIRSSWVRTVFDTIETLTKLAL